MLKKITLTVLSICMLTSSLCFAQETGSGAKKRYYEGEYTIGVDIPMGEYVFLTNYPDEIGYYVIYDGNNMSGEMYREKYFLKNEERYSYPDLMKNYADLRIGISGIPENAYNKLYDDYFEYCTVVNFNDYKSPEKTKAVSLMNVNSTAHIDLKGCYIKLVNCCAVPEAQVTKLDVSRNGCFKAGRDFAADTYTVEYVGNNTSDIRYTAVNNIFSKTVGRTAELLYVKPETSEKTLIVNNNDYVDKRDVNLKNSKGETIAHKPRAVEKSLLDEKYDITQVREGLKKSIGDEINKNLGDRYYYQRKAKSSPSDDIKTTDNWLSLAENDAEKQYVYMISEMYYLVNSYLRDTIFSVDRDTIEQVKKDGLTMQNFALYDKVTSFESNIAPSTYKQLFTSIQSAKNFSEIKYICDKMVADMY